MDCCRKKMFFQTFLKCFFSFLTDANMLKHSCSQKALIPTQSLTQLVHLQISAQSIALY